MNRPATKRLKKQHIHIAVPTQDNVVGYGVVPFLTMLEGMSLSAACPYRFSWEMVHQQTPVEYARNKLVTKFLRETEAEKLWFIDTDMVVPADALELLTCDADIVAPVAFAFNHANGGWSAGLKLCLFKYDEEKRAFHSVVPADGAPRRVPLEGAGTAAMVIKRHVLEDKRMWLNPEYTDLNEQPATLDPDKDVVPIFRNRYKPNGEIMRGEDLDFCLRAHRLGYSIVGDLKVRFGHNKVVDLDHVAQFANTMVKRLANNLQVRPNVGVETPGVTDESQVDRQDEHRPVTAGGDVGGSGRPSGKSVGAKGTLRRGVRHPQHVAAAAAAAGTEPGRGVIQPGGGQGEQEGQGQERVAV